MWEKIKEYRLIVATRKVGLMLANVMTSGAGGAWVAAKIEPFVTHMEPTLGKFGIHIDSTALGTAAALAIGTFLYDFYGVVKPKEEGK